MPEHQGGTLDWYSFTHDTGASLPAASRPHPTVSTTLPARASYAGMPAARFWELEDSRVDFGGVEAAPSDLARMLVLDFATIYGNDWYVIPVSLPIGTLTAIHSLIVGDTFGGQWSIGPAAEPGWVMYQLTAQGPDAAAAGGRLDRLLLPPALAGSLESEPLEDVLLLRDEDANTAWAIEHTVEGIAGAPVDRAEAWHERRRWHGDPAAHAGAPGQIAPLAYRLAAELPEHWIPLLPETTGPGQTKLRVSALERPGNGGPPVPILPQGRLLEPGSTLLLPEEEVPAEGARLTRTWQYARWTDGSTHLWAARRKRAGRGPASSGLAFDLVEPWRPQTLPLAYEPVRLQITTQASGGDPVDLDRLTPGQTAVVRWETRNTGTQTWARSGTGALRLGTSDDRDHPGRLASPSWLNSIRPASPAESVIAPGQVATFLFEITAPTHPGLFEEAYEPVIEARDWLVGPGLHIHGRVLS